MSVPVTHLIERLSSSGARARAANLKKPPPIDDHGVIMDCFTVDQSQLSEMSRLKTFKGAGRSALCRRGSPQACCSEANSIMI
jgi:hypothetical protein